MAKLTIIVGMAGSGKSYLGKKIEESSGAKLFEDATSTRSKDRRRAGHETLAEMVARLLGRDQDCVMEESHLIVPRFRRYFKSFCDCFLEDVEQEWIFFEPDALSCINNVFEDIGQPGREKPKRLDSLSRQIDEYKSPELFEDLEAFPGEQKMRAVYRCPNPKFGDEASARTWLRGASQEE